MEELKIMPCSEKKDLVRENIEFLEGMINTFIEKELGKDKAEEHLQHVRSQYRKILRDETEEELYEKHYDNWIHLGKSNFDYVRKHLGEEGVQRLIRTETDFLIQKNKGPAVSFLGLVRKLSKKKAFKIAMKDMTYQLQWITPYSVIKSTDEEVLCDIRNCKILNYDDTDDICYLGCMKIYPQWIREQMEIDMNFQRDGRNCTLTVKPI